MLSFDKLTISLMIVFLASTSILSAQQETLFGRAHSAGFFFSPIVEYSMWNNEVRASSGGGMGLVIDNFFIGGYGVAAIDLDALIDDNGDRVEVDIAHSGLWLGYVWPSHKVFHLYGSVKGGWGLIDTEISSNGFDRADRVFVVTPDVGVEVNLFRWLRLAGTVGYRAVNGVDTNSTIPATQYNGVTGGLTLRIGWFGRHHRRFEEE